jgi:membrane protein YdbS with pleckstrin-like domain
LEEPFTNEDIDIALLPKFEEVKLTPLHPSYIKVIWFNIVWVFVVIAIALAVAIYNFEELQPYLLPICAGYLCILIFTVAVYLISFRTQGFKFREKDIIYRSGAISVSTIIIPYNRVQHVAIHEGPLSRWLDLATVQVFTAGGTGGDINIPGIEKIHASAIKQLVIGKISIKEEEEEKDLYTASTAEPPLPQEASNDEGNRY